MTWCNSHDANFVGSQSLLISMERIKYQKYWEWHFTNNGKFFWSLSEEKQHSCKNKTKISQSETSKGTILKIKWKVWFLALCVFLVFEAII